MRVRFAECLFDTERHQLTRAGRSVELSPKAFRLLALLLERRPKLVARAELHDLLWPESYVGRTSLPRLVSEVRRAIGDDGEAARLVRTVFGVGYAFVGETPPAEASARTAAALDTSWRMAPVDAAPEPATQRVEVVVVSGPLDRDDLEARFDGAWIAGRVRLRDGREIEIGPAPLQLGSAGPELRR